MGDRLRTSLAAKVVLALTLALLAVAPASEQPVGQAAAIVQDVHELKVDRRTVVAASAPAQVAVRQQIAIKGVAQVRGRRAAKPRPVRLLERRGSKWVRIGARRTSRIGDFAFRVSGKSRTGVRTFKVRIPRHKGLRAGATSVLRVRVVRTAVRVPAPVGLPPLAPTPVGSYDPPEPIPAGEPAPQGVSTDWTWLYDDGGRWNPCSVISWGYYAGRGYPGAVNDVKRAFAKISARTGLRFRYAGTVSAPPGPGMSAVPGFDIVVGWSDAGKVPQLAGSVVGLASAIATSTTPGADVRWRLQRGWVALDADAVLRPGYDVSGWPTWGQVMVHEALHTLGLGHAGHQVQVMYGAVSSLNHRFGAGDLGGMLRVGTTYGCLD